MNRPSNVDGVSGWIWLTAIIFLAWVPAQDDFHLILVGIVVSFTGYFYILFRQPNIPFTSLIILAVIARLAVIPTFPNLSDDVFRFIWDGRLWHLGIPPYSVLPSEVVNTHPSLSHALYEQLNSQGYYSIYPPIPQFLFWCATSITSLNFEVETTIMKGFHALFDIASIYVLMALLKAFELPKERVLIYALNPLIVLELVNNLHHEGIVIFFLFTALYFVKKERYLVAGALFSCAIATKILPILFLPLLFFYLKGRNRWQFVGVTIVTTSLLFLPMWANSQIIANIGESANLYIRKFEFNASIYYVLRALGYMVKGYNTIHVLGPFLMGLAGILIWAVSIIPIRRRITGTQLFTLIMWTYMAYAILSITLHPWYIALLIPLSCFTGFRTPLLWSALILLTYINYSYPIYSENLWVVAFEYLVVCSLFIVEVKQVGFLNNRKARSYGLFS